MKAALMIVVVLAALALAQAVPAYQDVVISTVAPPAQKDCIIVGLKEVASYFSQIPSTCAQKNTNIVTNYLCIASSAITGVRAAVGIITHCILA